MHVKLPENFTEKNVEIIILVADEKNHQQQITEDDALTIHSQLMDQYTETFEKLAQ